MKEDQRPKAHAAYISALSAVAHHVVWGSSLACLLIIVVAIVLIYKCKSPLYKLLCKKRAAATKSIEEPKNEQYIELMNDRPQFA